MAIHEHWADAIMDGRKTVEFRKRRLAPDIDTVIVYATAPVSMVIGRFTIAEVVSGTPEEIWSRFGDVGEIDHASYSAYYEGRDSAVAIVVAEASRFDDPLALADIEPRPAVPQSFAYLPAATPALAGA
ncbi:ASCH domain-containing protein [Microbacterium sp. NPDC089696]|uniref:ASCH domain-containing protein n=1 Tax=Microbacterium sp. NPDC089696 TaxID=3364199 RepID=UPI003807A68B